MEYLYLLFTITLSFTTNAQHILGQWETFDDKTKEKKQLLRFIKLETFILLK